MEGRLPEFVVFKDICTDGEKCSLENCELNHHNIYYLLNYELDNKAGLDHTMLQVTESKPESYEGIVKQFESTKLLMNDEADTRAEVEIAEAISFCHGKQSLDGELRDQKDNQDQQMRSVLMTSKEAFSDSTPDSMSKEGSGPNSKAENSSSMDDDGTTPRSLASFFANMNTDKQLPDHEDSKPVVVSASKQSQDNISIRSSSTNSTQSFAFPVLTTEWTSSPVRMVEANKRDFKRRSCCWRMCFDICKF